MLPAAPAPAPAPGRERSTVDAVAGRRRSARARRRRRRFVLLWAFAALLVAVVSFGGGLLLAPVDFAAPPQPRSAVLLDSQGRVFATIRSPQAHEEVAGNKIPPVVGDAVIAAEDERFFSHSGIDPMAVLRAAWHDLTGSSLQGGSTLTQQYVKNVYTNKQRTALRKLREAALAYRLEHHLSKQQILTRYLNTLYLGNGTYGVQAASKFYFGVPVDQLDLDPATGRRDPTLALARAALLAGSAPAPSVWNSIADPKAARDRQLYTLNRMVANGMISADQASAAYAMGMPRIVARREPDLPTVAPEFRDLVAQQLVAKFGQSALDLGGLTARTTLDLTLQRAVVQALHEVLPKASDPEAAVVAVDPRNGNILALTEKRTGGYQDNGFDLATNAMRDTGSTIKPFTLAAALGQGYRLDQMMYAPSIAYVPNPGGAPNPYPIPNAEAAGARYLSLRTALAESVNTVYGPLALKVGLRHVFNIAQAAGLAPATDFRTLEPAKSIGGGLRVTPLSEAVAFSTLVDHGVHHSPRLLLHVTSATGGASYSAPGTPAGNRVLPAAIADQVTSAMASVVAPGGTAAAAAQPFPVYGKTGTTDNYTNAWFTGCSRTVCIAVWMGYDRPYLANGTPHAMVNVEGVGKVYGGTLPAEIFARAWSDYRALQRQSAAGVTPGRIPLPSPSPSRTAYRQPAAPAPQRSAAVPTRSAPAPTRSPSRRPSASPSPTPSGILPLG